MITDRMNWTDTIEHSSHTAGYIFFTENHGAFSKIDLLGQSKLQQTQDNWNNSSYSWEWNEITNQQ